MLLFLEYISIFVFGGIAYGSLEVLYRGYTHWTMLLTGGACSCLIHIIGLHLKVPLWKKQLACAAVITTVEWLVGILVNLHLGWQVWDYSRQFLNLSGQICPLYTLYWFLLSLPCLLISTLLRRYVFPRPAPQPDRLSEPSESSG